jgi:DNA helicase HerA-like ATPase
VFFCTQLPTDIPNNVLSQLGARIQHALRAFTPDDQAALAKTVKTYPKTKFYELETALTSLGIGEAIVTVLSERGAPTPVAWTRLRAPRSKMGSIGPEAVAAAVASSDLHAKYAETIDRESAYEKLAAKIPPDAPPAEAPAAPEKEKDEPGFLESAMKNPAVKSFMRSAASALGREITRGLFGNRRR